MKNFLPKNIFLLTIALIISSCGSARRSEAVTGVAKNFSGDAAHGEKVFMRFCNRCHPGGEAGLGPGINDKPLPGFLLKFQVRHGMGAMPAFSDRVISGEELDNLVDYLYALRKHGA